MLAELVASERPGLVFIDTVWRATRRRLNKEDEVNTLMTPIVSIAQMHDVAILGLMHLSKDQDTLGRRLEGLARGIMKLYKPDPAKPNRRRLEVIGNFKEPPPLGVTIHDGGCEFDSFPPVEPAKNSGGRPPEERGKARQFILDALVERNDQIGTELCGRWQKDHAGIDKTFWRAVEGYDRGWRTDDRRGTGDSQANNLAPEPDKTSGPLANRGFVRNSGAKTWMQPSLLQQPPEGARSTGPRSRTGSTWDSSQPPC